MNIRKLAPIIQQKRPVSSRSVVGMVVCRLVMTKIGRKTNNNATTTAAR